MPRFNWIVLATGLAIGLLSVSQSNAQEEFPTNPMGEAQFELYERQLNAILKTRRDQEKRFVKQVVNRIRLGRIPVDLVNTSFKWVLNRRPGTRYPFVYFERVLRIRATKAGIGNAIPPFNFDIYSQSTRRPPKNSFFPDRD